MNPELQIAICLLAAVWVLVRPFRQLCLRLLAIVFTIVPMTYLVIGKPGWLHFNVLKLTAVIFALLDILDGKFNIINSYKHARMFILRQLVELLKKRAEKAEKTMRA